MNDLLEKVVRVAAVRSCAVVDMAGAALVSFVRDGGDASSVEGAARDLAAVTGELLGDADGPSVIGTFESGAQVLARRFGTHFAMVVVDKGADLVDVRVALQGLALKISLQQRALSLGADGDSPRPPPSAPSDRPSRPSRPDARESQAALSTRGSSPPARDSGSPLAARPSSSEPGASAVASNRPAERPSGVGRETTRRESSPARGGDRAVSPTKTREDLVKLFSQHLGPMAQLLVDEQIDAHGGLTSSGVALAIGEALIEHVRVEAVKKKVRAELDRLVGAPPVAARPAPPPAPVPSPSAPPAAAEPYRSAPETIDAVRLSALRQVFVEFVGPIGQVVFDEELASTKTGPHLLRTKARALLQALANHVPAARQKAFTDRGERTLG